MKPFFQSGLTICLVAAASLTGCGSEGQLDNDLDKSQVDLRSWAEQTRDQVRDWGSAITGHYNTEMELWNLRARLQSAKDENNLGPGQLNSMENSIKFIERERAKLDKLNGSQLAAQRVKLDRDLDRLSDRLDVWTSTAKLDFGRKLQDLRQKATIAKTDDNLSKEQESSLNNSLRWIDNLTRRSNSDGSISQSERSNILSAINRVDRRLDGWTAAGKAGSNSWF